MKPRTYLDDAIDQLTREAKCCPLCRRWFVYGRQGAEYCSGNCARAMAQRNFRKRRRATA